MSGKETDKKTAVNGWINVVGVDGLLIRRIPLSDGDDPEKVKFEHQKEIADSGLKPETPKVSD